MGSVGMFRDFAKIFLVPPGIMQNTTCEEIKIKS